MLGSVALQHRAAAVVLDSGRPTRQPRGCYRLPPGGFAGPPPLPWLAKGEAGAASFGFSFLGFLASRLPRCSPLAIAFSVAGQVPGQMHFPSVVELSSR